MTLNSLLDKYITGEMLRFEQRVDILVEMKWQLILPLPQQTFPFLHLQTSQVELSVQTICTHTCIEDVCVYV